MVNCYQYRYKFGKINYRNLEKVILKFISLLKYLVKMQKKRSVYNIWSAKELQFESCQDVTRFVRRFIDSAITAAIKIAAVMVR